MKMTSKMMRVQIPSEALFKTTKFTTKAPTTRSDLTDEDRAKIRDLDEYHQIIYPWQQHLSEDHKAYFYHNTKTDERVWELPEAVAKLAEVYFESKAEHENELQTRNLENFISKDQLKKGHNFKDDWMERPAAIQKDLRYEQDFAYKEGDYEYNIWYDKTIQDEIVPVKEASKNRCDPTIHCGYTKADTHERHQSFFCFHFSRGNCYLGHNCNFYHHIPSLEECLAIDNGKDIFGRSRFATHRKDNQGIGNFLKETRTLKVSDFCVPQDTPNGVVAAYEVLWRHFSLWGEIEDIFFLTGHNIAYIRYEHRCMAEFAKEAMRDQTLDADEIVTVQWCENDNFELSKEDYDELNEQAADDEAEKKKKKRRTIFDYQKEVDEKVDAEIALKKRSNDPTKVVVEAEFKLFEQRLKQVKKDQDRLSQAFGKMKKGDKVEIKMPNIESMLHNE